MKKHPLNIMLLLALLIFCPTSFALEKQPIYIGALYSLDGTLSTLGGPALKGAKLAISEINTKGGILGRPVQLKLLNTQSSPEITTKKAQELANIVHINIITGLVGDDMLSAAMPSIVNNNKLFITSGATSGQLARDYPNNLVLSCYTDAMQGSAAAQFAMKNLKANKVIVIHNTKLQYAKNVSQAFVKEFQSLNGKILHQITFTPDTLNIEELLQQIKPLKNQLQAIYFASSVPKTLAIINALRKAGINQPIIGADGFDSDAIVKAKQTNLNNIYFTTHAVLSPNDAPPSTQTFIRAFQKKYNEYPHSAFAALGYDATMLAAKILIKTNNKPHKKLEKILSNLGPYLGASSKITYKNSNIPDKSIYVIKINQDQRELASVIDI